MPKKKATAKSNVIQFPAVQHDATADPGAGKQVQTKNADWDESTFDIHEYVMAGRNNLIAYGTPNGLQLRDKITGDLRWLLIEVDSI